MHTYCSAPFTFHLLPLKLLQLRNVFHVTACLRYKLFLVSFSDKWSPALQIRTVLLSIQALLSAPNPDDPLANDVAEQWKTNEAKAIDTGNTCFDPIR